MAEPATLPGDEPNTIRSGGHEGLVYVHNPLNGEVEAVQPDLAAQRVYTQGWAPVSKADAERVDAQQLLKDSITPGEAIGQGLVRGVTGGLSDLVPGATESDARLSAAIDEKHPWLTAGAEAAGFLAPFGVGAGLSRAGGAVTGALRGGAELGLLGKMGTRALGMGAEGAAYGAIGAARESKLQDDPLTAQKLLSGMFGGAIIGGGLGAGVGALEGSSSLIRGMFKNSSKAREELNAPGLRDSDISPILERAGLGPVEPGALQELQAVLYNNPNVTPEMLAAVAKSPGIKADMFVAGHEQRAMAESSFAKALNKLHDGNQDALHGWEGALKADKVRQWIGPEAEHVSDAGNLVEMLKIMDVPGRFNLSQDIVEAVKRAGKANPEAFAELMNSVSATSKEEALRNIDRALLHGNKDVLDHLFASRLLNDESIAALRRPVTEHTVDAGIPAIARLDDLPEVNLDDALPNPPLAQIRAHDAEMAELEKRFPPTPEERDAIRKFSFGYDQDMRAVQRGNGDTTIVNMRRADPKRANNSDTELREHVGEARVASDALLNYIKKAPPASNAPIVYRGLRLSEEEALAMMQGRSVSIGDAVASVSDNPNIALGFASPENLEQVGVLLKLEQRSARGVHNLAVTDMRNERELLMPGGAKFEIIGRHSGGNRLYIIEAREIENAAQEMGAVTSQGELRKLLRVGERPQLIEPAWKTAALDFIDRHKEYLGELLRQPKGYVSGKGGAGEIKRLHELLGGAKDSVVAGDRANAFIELDMVKKRLAAVRAEAGERIPTGQNIRGFAGTAHEEARALLEDASIWGAKAAGAQKEMNAILHERFTHNNDFYNAFYSGAGVPDPKNPWTEKKVADPNKIAGAMDRLVHPERSMELEQFKRHIAESNRIADVMEKYYSPDDALKAKISAMRAGVGEANKSMDDALHFARRINQGKILAEAAHGSAAGAAAHLGAYVLGGPLGVAGSVVAKALLNPGRIWRMQAVVERMLGSHSGRLAEGLAKVANSAGRAAESAGKQSTRVLGSTAMITQDVAKRQKAYSETLQDLAAMATSAELAVKAISSWHGPDFAHMPNVIPGMAEAIQRGAMFCLSVAPSRPKPGLFSDDELGLISDGEAEEFSNTVHAAMDPASVFEFIDRGQLTPQVLKAAETTAPELVEDMRQQAIQFFTTTQGNVKVSDLRRSGLALLLGIQPNPVYVQAIQASWQSEQTNPTERVTVGNQGDTGVNERYAKSHFSAADRIESGVDQP